MKDLNYIREPDLFQTIKSNAQKIGFEMAADEQTGSLLRTLVASKSNSQILELGTGVGASLCWMVEGLDQNSRLISIDNDPKLIAMVQSLFEHDPRVQLICQDGDQWIKDNLKARFDLIFADAWPGKYSQADTILDMLNPGGIYLVDDMTPQPNWPPGHENYVQEFGDYLLSRTDLMVTALNWSTGIIVATKV